MTKRPNVIQLWQGTADTALRRVGARTDTVRNAYDLADAMRFADALLLTGGGDVDPLRYDEDASPKVYGVSPERDAFEFDAVRWAVRIGVPMFGICRGSQVINVALGGTLYQDLPTTHKGRDEADEHGYGYHPIRVDKSSRLADSIGLEVPEVTTLHHQACRTMGRGLKAVAWAPDGTIEAFESSGKLAPITATQFHPEIDARQPKGEGGYALDLFAGWLDQI